MDRPRCYRCLVPALPALLEPVTAACGCEHRYCQDCLRDPLLQGFLIFVATRCQLPRACSSAA